MLHANVIAGNAKLLEASCMSRLQCDQAAMAETPNPKDRTTTSSVYTAMQAYLVDSGDHTNVSHTKSVEFVGNRTECALLLMLRGWGLDYKAIRDNHRAAVQKVYTFSSATKMASVLVSSGDDAYRLYVKVSHCDMSW